MKQKILLSAVLVWAVMNGFAQIGQAGQKVVTGSQWNIGWGQFEAHAKPALIQMTSVHEGEAQAFVLKPNGANQYIYSAAPEELGEDPQIVPQGAKVVVKNQEGLKVGRTMSLYHADPEQGRWHFASEAMLNRCTLGHYRKSSLRLMRNEILASHGYKFTTKDLVAYFTSQPWYHPAESNDHVQLSFYEQMTVALIQAEERKPDSQRSPIEEDPIWK